MSTLPTHQTTMIGSMPHLTPKEALLALEQVPLTIPAWPQLPRRSFKEALIPQYTEAFPGIRVDEVAKRIWVQVDEDLPNAMVGFYENLVSSTWTPLRFPKSTQPACIVCCDSLPLPM